MRLQLVLLILLQPKLYLSLNLTVLEEVDIVSSLSPLGPITAVAPKIVESTPNAAPKRKKPVPLTMRQGLVLNQILAIYSLDKFENEMCRKHTEEFKQDIRALEPWALKMFDSSSKLQAGVMVGNLMEFGDFKQCIEIDQYSESGRIRGKHCVLKLHPSMDIIQHLLAFRNISAKRFPKIKQIVEPTVFRWSVCVPDSCNAEEVFHHFNKNIIELTHGLDVKVTLDKHHCVTKEDLPKMGTIQYLVLTFLGLFVVICIIAGILDYKNPETKSGFINSFSVLANYKRLLAKGNQSDLDCVHGLRFLSTLYVVVGHRFLMTLFFPVQNSLELLDWILYYSSTPILGGTVCVDSFFMISGMLTSYGFFEHVTKTGRFQVIPFYLHRYLRITTPLAIVLLILTTLVQFLGSGPLWYDTYTSQQCMLATWYLSCDMPYFYVSPLVLYPLWKFPVFGYINYIVIYVLSIGVSFYLAWTNEFQGGMPITSRQHSTRVFRYHYIAPHTRASPYLIGVGLGLAIFKTRERKIKIGILMQVAGWAVTAASMTAAVMGSHSFVAEDYEYNRLEASVYLSCMRSAWTFGLVWITWCCVNGYGGIINHILSWQLFRVLGRVGYGTFLLHIIMQFLKSGASKLPVYFSNFQLFYESMADMTVSVFMAIFFTLFYELPLVRTEELLFKQKVSKTRRVEPKN